MRIVRKKVEIFSGPTKSNRIYVWNEHSVHHWQGPTDLRAGAADRVIVVSGGELPRRSTSVGMMLMMMTRTTPFLRQSESLVFVSSVPTAAAGAVGAAGGGNCEKAYTKL